MKIEVKHTPAGWIVIGGMTMGPFAVESRAVDLAEGMAQALRTAGEPVELVIRPGPGPGGDGQQGETGRAAAGRGDCLVRTAARFPIRALRSGA